MKTYDDVTGSSYNIDLHALYVSW